MSSRRALSVPVSSAAISPDGISAPSPLPSPPSRATADLLRQFAVCDGPPRGRVEGDDRLPERGRLREPDGTGNDRSTHFVTEVLPHLSHDLIGELRARVVHDADDRAHLERRVEVALHQVDVAEQLP